MNAISPRFAGQPAAAFKLGLACAVTLLLAGATAHANGINLVQNGDFSQNNGLGQLGWNNGSHVLAATDWSNPFNQYNFLFSSSNPTGTVAGQYGNLSLINVTAPPVGADFLAADADFQTGAIKQTINGLTVGDTYQLFFYWAASQQTGFSGPTVQEWKVSLGSQTDTTENYNLPSHGFSGWMPAWMDFTATNSSETLSFLAAGSPQVPPFTLATDISMQDLKVTGVAPEPETLPLLLTGLLVCAGLLKYRGSMRRSQQSL